MSSVTVCVRFRPLNSRERKMRGDRVCILAPDAESFVFKDEKEDLVFAFDRVFYQDSTQIEVYEFLALPIVQDAVNGINGTIITYGQTGAGKTYSMEGTTIISCDENDKGLVPRVVDGIFECTKLSTENMKYDVKLSMVEIYMEKIRDLFDLSKDNLQIKEGKCQEILLSGTTEISITDTAEALRWLSKGISNRAVGETQMNRSSSRSHCVYIFSIQQEFALDRKMKTGKLVLVDLAGSEKVEKTGAGGRVLEEAKTINKSLSALGNVVNALTTGKMNHIPYRDSKLTRLLQDGLGGNSRTALLCCCSPSSLNASESLSTVRFGSRAKRIIKMPPRASVHFDKGIVQQVSDYQNYSNSWDRISDVESECPTAESGCLTAESGCLTAKNASLLEEQFIMEGVSFDPNSVEDVGSAYDVATSNQTMSSLHEALEDLRAKNDEMKREYLTAKNVSLLEEQFRSQGASFDPRSVDAVVSAYNVATSNTTISSPHEALEDLSAENDKMKRECLTANNVSLFEEQFITEGVSFDPCSVESSGSLYDVATSNKIFSSPHEGLDELRAENDEMKRENSELEASEYLTAECVCLTTENVSLSEEKFRTEGVSLNPHSVEGVVSPYDVATSNKTFSLLHQAVEGLRAENDLLKWKISALEAICVEASNCLIICGMVACISCVSCSLVLLSKNGFF